MRWRRRPLAWLAIVLAFVVAQPGFGKDGTGKAPSGSVEITWLGQSAMRIETPGGKVIVIDPFLTRNPKTPAEWKDLKRLGHVDLILVTHGHADHVGDAFELSRMNDAKVYAPAGLADTFTTLGSIRRMRRR